MLTKFLTNASDILFSWRDNLSLRCYTLGPLCLWQCLDNDDHLVTIWCTLGVLIFFISSSSILHQFFISSSSPPHHLFIISSLPLHSLLITSSILSFHLFITSSSSSHFIISIPQLINSSHHLLIILPYHHLINSTPPHQSIIK